MLLVKRYVLEESVDEVGGNVKMSHKILFLFESLRVFFQFVNETFKNIVNILDQGGILSFVHLLVE